jgi:hypothetical protein
LKDSVVKNSDTRLLSRREFNERCVALGSLVTLSGALALDAAPAVAATATARMVKFRDGTMVPAIGQGLGISGREDIRQLMKKKRYARAFRSG